MCNNYLTGNLYQWRAFFTVTKYKSLWKKCCGSHVENGAKLTIVCKRRWKKTHVFTVKNPLSKLCIITIVCFMNATVSLFSGCKGHLPADLTWSTNPLRKDACSQSGGKRTDMLKALHSLSYHFLVFSPTNSPKLPNMTWTFLYAPRVFLCVVAFQRIHVALLHRLCRITSRAKKSVCAITDWQSQSCFPNRTEWVEE